MLIRRLLPLALTCRMAPLLLALSLLATPLQAGDAAPVITQWYRLGLELVRHTPTYSPPVASRAFAYLGVTLYEAIPPGDPARLSLPGQLAGLTPPPPRAPGPHLSALGRIVKLETAQE